MLELTQCFILCFSWRLKFHNCYHPLNSFPSSLHNCLGFMIPLTISVMLHKFSSKHVRKNRAICRTEMKVTHVSGLSVQTWPTHLQRPAMLLEILLQTFPVLCSSYVLESPTQVEFCASQNWLCVCQLCIYAMEFIWNPNSSMLEPDQSPRHCPKASVIAQKHSSDTLISLCF